MRQILKYLLDNSSLSDNFKAKFWNKKPAVVNWAFESSSRNKNSKMAQIIERVNMAVGDSEMKAIDANRYATKKTIAQGMLDIALLTANASQLKYILQIGEQHQFYKMMLILISLSIVLQILAGVLSLSLSFLRDCRMHLPQFHRSANIINHIRTGFAFSVTMINLFISAFDSRLPPPQGDLLNNISAGLLLIAQSMLSIHKTQQQRDVAYALNHLITGVIFLSVFCDVVKMNFGLEAAIPITETI